MSKNGRFLSTRWSLVQAAAGTRRDTRANRALNELAGSYWQPLYWFLRRRGCKPAEAEDLTQEFFARLLEKHFLGSVDRSKGKFRSFLLASLQHFLCNEWDRNHAKKRGGGRRMLPFDTQNAEHGYAAEPVDDVTPEDLFNRRWAMAVLEHVVQRLRKEYIRCHKEKLFEGIKSAMAGELEAPSYAAIGAAQGMTPGAVKAAAFRLRARFRELMHEEVAQTVANPELVGEEVGDLLNCL